MAFTLQILHRTTGGQGSPSGDNNVGELAVNFDVPIDSQPELWSNDGTIWKRINPDLDVDIAYIALPGGNEGDKTGIGVAWTAYTPKPTEPFVVAAYGTVPYLMIGDPELDIGWTAFVSESATASIFAARDDAEASRIVAASAASASVVAAEESSDFADNAEQSAINAASVACQDLASMDLVLAQITGTVVRVFRYDTAKDSDRGAWRERCEHLPWYQETLNTATRGKTRKHPAVVDIVVEIDKVTFFDVTDPTAPMWMVIPKDALGGINTTMWWRQTTGTPASSAYMLNGILCIGISIVTATSNAGLITANFIKDDLERYSGLASNSNRGVSISERGTLITLPINTGSIIADSSGNDVSMTIIDNAPMDSETGVAVPTMAVATDSGVSVIDGPAGVGTVVDMISANTTYEFSYNVDFVGGLIRYTLDSGSKSRYTRTEEIPTTDVACSAPWTKTSDEAIYALFIESADIDLQLLGTTKGIQSQGFVGSELGLTRLYEDTDTPANGMVDYTTDKSFSGIMQGDIRLATLADTSAGDLSPFDTTPSTGNVDVIVVGNTLETTAVASGYLGSITSIQPDPPTGLKLKVEVTLTSGEVNLEGSVAQEGGGSPANFLFKFTASGTQEVSLPYNTISASVWWTTSATFEGTLEVLSLTPVIEDRCVKDNPLDVIGTITKSPVADGAELQAYGGYGSSDRIVQPHTTDLDVDTGDFHVMGWVNPSVLDTLPIFSRGLDADVTAMLYLGLTGTTGLIQVRAGNDTLNTQQAVLVNAWSHVVFSRISGVIYVHINATIDLNTTASIEDMDLVSDSYIGVSSYDLTAGIVGVAAISLVRFGAGAPSDTQIKEIYELEKKLFEPNAKCTLQGDSTDVKALSYDVDKNKLYAGTVDGITTFLGLVVDEHLRDDKYIISVSAGNGGYIAATTSEAMVFEPAILLREELNNLYKPEYYEKIVTDWTLGIATDVPYNGEVIHAVYVDGLLLNPATKYTVANGVITLSVAPVTETCVMTYRGIK